MFDGALQDADLMAQGEDLELERRPAAKAGEQRVSEGRKYGPERQTNGNLQLSNLSI